MPDVSFYILASESQQERHLFACKLIEKIYRSGQSCYVLTDNAEQSQQIDDLLWTFRAGSFIPHQIYTGELPDIARDGVYAASPQGAGAAIARDGVYAENSQGASLAIARDDASGTSPQGASAAIVRDGVNVARPQGAGAVNPKVILIGSLDAPEGWQKNLLNLSSECPHTFAKSERILEILDNSEATKAAGRQRYRYYQQAHIAITTHKINHAG